MVFGTILSDLVETIPGAQAALVMGYDGIPLDQYAKANQNGLDLQTVGVEYCSILNEIKKHAQQMGLAQNDAIQEITVRADSWTLLIRMVNEEYFAIMALDSNAYFGKGRYLLRHAVSQVRNEL